MQIGRLQQQRNSHFFVCVLASSRIPNDPFWIGQDHTVLAFQTFTHIDKATMQFYILKERHVFCKGRRVSFGRSVPGYRKEDKGIQMWHGRPAQPIPGLAQLGSDNKIKNRSQFSDLLLL